eukprot:555564-Prorocentrum_lima.AAC.1
MTQRTGLHWNNQELLMLLLICKLKKSFMGATQLLQDTNEEEFHQKKMVSVLENTVRELSDEL